jgi:hypothetical protein
MRAIQAARETKRPEVPMKSLHLVTVQAEDLARIINDAVAKALTEQRTQQAADCAGLSLNASARLARRRREVVAAALASGALPGKQYGNSKTRPRWSIIAADVRTWLTAGCPVTKAGV